jgi:hypothetical protein
MIFRGGDFWFLEGEGGWRGVSDWLMGWGVVVHTSVERGCLELWGCGMHRLL